MAKYKRKRKTGRKYRRKSPARKKKRKRRTSKRPNVRRRRAARRIQRTYRKYKRTKRKSFKKKMNRIAKRVNTYLEPRVIRHGWSPIIGGGMGFPNVNAQGQPTTGPGPQWESGNQYQMPGNNPSLTTASGTPQAVYTPGLFNWMIDVSTAHAWADCRLAQPPKRHNPLLYMRVATANDFNPWWKNIDTNGGYPQTTPAMAIRPYSTCQPRTKQYGQSYPIAAVNSAGGWVGGAFRGGYDQLVRQYHRPTSMLNTARLFQSCEDCIAYKEFPFIPRMEKDFDPLKFNGSLDGGGGPAPANDISMMTATGAASRFERLEKWETRDGDKVMVKNNYHKFHIEVFPDLAVEIPVTNIEDHMPGLPENWGDGGVLGQVLTTSTQGKISAPAADTTTTWPGYVKKQPKWFCKIRFVVAKRQRRPNELWGNDPLRFIGNRDNQLTQGTQNARPGNFAHLYTMKKYFQKYCMSTSMESPNIDQRGEYLNVPEPGRPPQAAVANVFGYAYKPSYIFDARQQASAVWAATKTRSDNEYKANISGIAGNNVNINYVTTNPKDETLKVIYEKEIKLSGKKRTATHIMNTLKGKVLQYLKETDENRVPGVLQSLYEQERTQYPIDEEYRMWVVVHCHNCRMQMKADHVFKFDA